MAKRDMTTRVRNDKVQWVNMKSSSNSDDTIEVDVDTYEEDDVEAGGEESEYELEKIVASKPNGSGQLLYLVRWKGWGPEFDEWKTTEDLEHAQDLVDIYEKPTGGETNAENSDADNSDYEEKRPRRMREEQEKKMPREEQKQEQK
ncbi:uncharacterized protein PAC_05958 [Phialocephala subalpina]|uniref:Chromo domain-containing protein n=1 Tax=Phialocephala subalpina TaxID=576137 RepID=A0A1L7WTH9_9HELO|nr:uncharacterized protein PAC_05958 [Phialocephala subalpina]